MITMLQIATTLFESLGSCEAEMHSGYSLQPKLSTVSQQSTESIRSQQLLQAFKPAYLDVIANSMIERTLEWGDKATRNEVGGHRELK